MQKQIRRNTNAVLTNACGGNALQLAGPPLEAMDAIPDLVYVFDMQGQFLYWNRAVAVRSGYTNGEIASMTPDAFFTEEEIPAIRSAIAETWTNGSAKLEAQIRTKQGQLVPYEFSNSLLRNASGEPIAVCGSARDLSERREVENALRDSERRFRNLFESARDAMMVLDGSGRFSAGNSAAVEMFGCRSEEEFMQCSPADLSPPFQPDGRPSDVAAREMVVRALHDGSHFFEWLHCRKDALEFEASVLLTRIELDGTVQVHATVRDISERKRLDKRLKRQAAELEQRVRELNCLELVSEILEMNDLPAADMVDRVVGCLPEGMRFPKHAVARIVFRDHKAQTGQYDDEAVCVEAPLLVDGVHAGSIDVCYPSVPDHVCGEPFLKEERALLKQTAARLGRAIERRRSYESVTTLKQELELILAQTGTRLIVVDENCIVRYSDPATERYYGSLDNQKCHRYLCLNSQRCTDCPNDRLAEVDQPFVNIIALPAEKGRVFQRTIVPIRAEGTHRLFAELLVDITEMKNMETDLNQARKLEAVGQLAAGIAHEINTPTQFVGDNTRFLRDSAADLELVLTALDQLLDAASKKEPCGEILDTIQKTMAEVDAAYLRGEMPLSFEQTLEGIEQISTIVRAMKEFSHPGTTTAQWIDLNRAVENTLTVSRSEWKNVAEVVTDLQSDLPPVPCFPADLNQAILNIVVNAAQAIEEKDEGIGKITVSTRSVDAAVEIAISDTGNGIPETVRPQIFDPFFTTKEVGKGTGQGLSIVHAVIVEKHGGTLELHTEVGSGTTFVLQLPLQEQPKNSRSLPLKTRGS